MGHTSAHPSRTSYSLSIRTLFPLKADPLTLAELQGTMQIDEGERKSQSFPRKVSERQLILQPSRSRRTVIGQRFLGSRYTKSQNSRDGRRLFGTSKHLPLASVTLILISNITDRSHDWKSWTFNLIALTLSISSFCYRSGISFSRAKANYKYIYWKVIKRSR